MYCRTNHTFNPHNKWLFLKFSSTYKHIKSSYCSFSLNLEGTVVSSCAVCLWWDDLVACVRRLKLCRRLCRGRAPRPPCTAPHCMHSRRPGSPAPHLDDCIPPALPSAVQPSFSAALDTSGRKWRAASHGALLFLGLHGPSALQIKVFYFYLNLESE